MKIKKYIPWVSLFVLGLGILSKAIMGIDDGHQHDFVSYYYGAKALLLGLNGYDAHTVSALSGQTHQSHLRFVYPPQMAWLFAPLTFFSFTHARLLFLGIKLVAGVSLIWLFLKYFVQKDKWVVFAIIALFAFRGPFTSDILAGNIATFESLFLWGGFLYILQKRGYLGVTLIAIAGSFKLLPLVFLGLILLTSIPHKWRIFGTGVGIAMAIQGLGFIVMPKAYHTFLTSPNPLDSSGYVNPSILAWLQFDVTPWLSTNGIFIPTFLIYFAWIIVFLSCMAVFFWKRRNSYPVHIQFAIATLSYALILPRLKDYSFILFVIPAYYVILSLSKPWQKTLVLALFCVSLWPYHHWLMLLLSLVILTKKGPRLE